MLSAVFDTISRVKSLFGLSRESRKRSVEEEDSDETPNAKVRRIDKPLGAINSTSSTCHNLTTMSSLDRSHLVKRREHPDEIFSWEKRTIGKENQFTRNSSSQESDEEVVVLEEDDNFGDVSHSKPCSHGFRKCGGAHRKDHVHNMQQDRKKQPSNREEVQLIDDEDDVIFIKDKSRTNQKMSFLQEKPILFSERIKPSRYPRQSDVQTVNGAQRNSHSLYLSGSLLGLGQPFQSEISVIMEQKKMPLLNKLDSPSVRSRIRSGNLRRATILKKSLPPPPQYFGVDGKLSRRWSGIDNKGKKPSALAFCSALDEYKLYNNMLQQFTSSDFSTKQRNAQFDPQALKLFEPQLKRNYSFSQLRKKKYGTEVHKVVETIDLSKDDVKEVGKLNEVHVPVAKTKPDMDLIEIMAKKDDDVVPIYSRKVDVQRTRERIPKTSIDRTETDRKHSSTHPNAVDQLIKKSLYTDDFLKDVVKRFSENKAKMEKDVQREKLTKKLGSQIRKQFEETLEERLNNYMKITDITEKVKEIIEEEEELPELTREMLDAVRDALQKGRSCVVARFGSNTITGADIQTLMSSNWLNDEVINNYMDMLTQRGQSNEYPSVYCFNTFFFVKLNNSGYSSIRRWTKKVDVFQKELLIIPLHLQIHWALAVVDFRQKTISYYDSMNGRKKNILQAIMKYLQDEKSDKKKENFDSSGWVLDLVENIPQQRNGFDCGVFACMFAEHLSRGIVDGSKKTSKCRRAYPPFPFSQDNMPYFRKRMIYEILSGKLLQ